MRHYQWYIDCDCKECYEDWLNNYDEEKDNLQWDEYWRFQKPQVQDPDALEEVEIEHVLQISNKPQDWPPLTASSKGNTSSSNTKPQLFMILQQALVPNISYHQIYHSKRIT